MGAWLASQLRIFKPALWPILGGVANAEHLHLIFNDLVDGDVGTKYQFAGVLGKTDPPRIGEGTQTSNPLVDRLRHATGSSGIVFSNLLDDVSQIAGGIGSPPDAHYLSRDASIRATTSS